MNLKKTLLAAIGLAFGASLANASGIEYTCDGSVAASTCTDLNTVIAGQYDSIFSNANADIYITYGTTGLGQSTTGFYNFVTYAAYVAQALGLTQNATGGSILGTTSSNDACTAGSTGCYNGIITVTNDSSILYYDDQGAPKAVGSTTSTELSSTRQMKCWGLPRVSAPRTAAAT